MFSDAKKEESSSVNVQEFLEYLMGCFLKSSVLVQFICIYSVGGRTPIVKYCLELTFKKKNSMTFKLNVRLR